VHPWIRERVPEAARREALAEELRWWLETAAQDLYYAATYQRNAPMSGEPAERYLHRWVPLATGAHVLIGPRYLGRDPNLPFVGVSGSSRPLTPADRDALTTAARAEYAAFRPLFVLLSTADPIGAWPGTKPEMRQLIGRLGGLRDQATPTQLALSSCRDLDCYERYERIYRLDVERNPDRPRHSRLESRDELRERADQALLFDVLVGESWAGLVAARPDSRGGMTGTTIAELVLDQAFRGNGYGRHLSVLLANAVPMPDEAFLMGTVHAANLPAYRAAVAAGRVDVGGELTIPL
jgi:hypothetical protein